MPSMGQLLIALAATIRATVTSLLDPSQGTDISASLEELRARRDVCMRAASRRARLAIDPDDEADTTVAEGEWLNYAATLVQVDRIVVDLSAPQPA